MKLSEIINKLPNLVRVQVFDENLYLYFDGHNTLEEVFEAKDIIYDLFPNLKCIEHFKKGSYSMDFCSPKISEVEDDT